MLSGHSWVLVTSHVPPRPAVEPSLLHVRDVVRDEVVAETIALVNRGPQFTGRGIEGDPDCVTHAGRINLKISPVRVQFQNCCPVLLYRRVVHVLLRSYGDEHLFTVRRELNIT